MPYKNKEDKNRNSRDYYQRKKDKVIKRTSDYQKNNKEKTRANQRKWREDNKERLDLEAHDKHLRRKFGITLDDYDTLLLMQDGRCAICNGDVPDPSNPRVKRFAVDHDHVTGKVRQLLCKWCNVALGFLREDPELLKKAAGYLEFHAKTKQFPWIKRKALKT